MHIFIHMYEGSMRYQGVRGVSYLRRRDVPWRPTPENACVRDENSLRPELPSTQ